MQPAHTVSAAPPVISHNGFVVSIVVAGIYGIPNVLSDDNVFIEGRRQTPLTKKKIEAWVNEVVPTFNDVQQKNYERNRQLIDLNYIPKEIEDNINREFNDVEVATRDKILGYFINKKLKTLIESIDEF